MMYANPADTHANNSTLYLSALPLNPSCANVLTIVHSPIGETTVFYNSELRVSKET